MFFVRFFRFSGFLCSAVILALLVFGTLDLLVRKNIRCFRVIQLAARILLVILIITSVVTGIVIGIKACGSKEADNQYVIVLGAGVNGRTPSVSLYERLVAAESYLNSHPNSIAVLSGGQGDGEDISEAQCMYEWLSSHGISDERLWMEPNAENTEQNIRYSLDVIEEHTGIRPTAVTVITSSYHLCRAELFTRRQNVEFSGVPAKVQLWTYHVQMFLREIISLWYYLLVR